MNPLPRWLRGTLAAVLFLLVGGLLFLAAMDRDLNHDEHQFIAPSVLISRAGLMPYRDFPMFHLPNLAFVYAALDHLTHQPVFSAKVLNALASAGIVALIFLAGTARRHPAALAPRHFWYTLAVAVLLLTDQLFTYTTGQTWNHELPAFLLIAAILSHVRGVETGRWGWSAMSGLCLGAAIGLRLTYAPVAVAFPCLLALAPLPRRARVFAILAWTGACLLALTPSIYFLFADRERFLFDNLQFPRLRLQDAADTRVHKTVIWWRKCRFFLKSVVHHSLPLTITCLLASLRPIMRRLRRQEPEGYGYTVCAVVLPLAMFGCFLPSRYQYQHFFVFAPTVALWTAYALRGWQAPFRSMATAALLALVLFGLRPLRANATKPARGIAAYNSVPSMLNRRRWFTTQLRADYAIIKSVHGPILTLAPIGVLEVGGQIFPEFASGPFAWRGAHLLRRDKRRQVGLVAPEDLEDFLRQRPPSGILTGVDNAELEKQFIIYANMHAFHAIPAGKHRILWLPD